MIPYTLKRTLYLLLAFFFVLWLILLIIRAGPSYFHNAIGEDLFGFTLPSAEAYFTKFHHGDWTFGEQYGSLLFGDAAVGQNGTFQGLWRGDLGEPFRLFGSHKNPPDVTALLRQTLPVSLRLALPALVVSLLLGVALSAVTASLRMRWLVRINRWLFLGLFSLSFVVLNPWILWLVRYRLGWLPWYGNVCFELPCPAGWLPLISLIIPLTSGIAYWMIGHFQDIQAQPAVILAQSQGLKRQTVLFQTILPRLVLVLLDKLPFILMILIVGTVVAESFYYLPGMGRLYLEAVYFQEHPILIGLTIVWCGAGLVARYLADLLIAWLDPRQQQASATIFYPQVNRYELS